MLNEEKGEIFFSHSQIFIFIAKIFLVECWIRDVGPAYLGNCSWENSIPRLYPWISFRHKKPNTEKEFIDFSTGFSFCNFYEIFFIFNSDFPTNKILRETKYFYKSIKRKAVFFVKSLDFLFWFWTFTQWNFDRYFVVFHIKSHKNHEKISTNATFLSFHKVKWWQT